MTECLTYKKNLCFTFSDKIGCVGVLIRNIFLLENWSKPSKVQGTKSISNSTKSSSSHKSVRTSNQISEYPLTKYQNEIWKKNMPNLIRQFIECCYLSQMFSYKFIRTGLQEYLIIFKDKC
jgi:hypothetical protein